MRGTTSTSTQAILKAQLDCPQHHTSIFIDPSGQVRSTSGIPLDRTKVTLTRSATKHGKQRAVPKGSKLLPPSNRTNPDFTGPLGDFHWDVAPGFYQVLANHAGCRSPAGHGTTGSTPVMSVPPPRVNLVVKLRCPHLRRASTRLTLKVVSRKGTGELLEAALTYRGHRRGHRRRIARAALAGSVGFRIGAVTETVTLDPSHGWAIFDLPPVRAHSRIVATFTGNGLLAPSHAATRAPG